MKSILPRSKTFITTAMLAGLLIVNSHAAYAVTKTWAGGTGTGLSWNTSGNWSPSGAPASGDDILFNTPGTITFSTMPASSISFNSITITNNSVVTIAGGTAITLTIGGTPGADLVIDGGGPSLTLGTNINLTLSAGSAANISGNFNINAGRTFNSDNSLVVTSVFGTVNNAGTLTCTDVNRLLFQSGSAYIHSQNGGTIPTATWDINSACNITGLTTTHPAGGDQSFGNLTYNSAGMSTNLTMAAGVSVKNAFWVQNTGSARLLMTNGSFNVDGDFNLDANFTISTTVNRTLTVTGNVSISGPGNLDFCSGATNGIVGTLNVGGDFTNFGAITENNSGTGKGLINFNGSIPQNFNQSGALVNTIDFGIDNVAGVTFSNSPTINGTLTLTNGILTIPAATTLTIASGNPIGGSGFGAAKHINTQVAGATQGFLRVDNMAAATAYTFPVGNGTHYLRATLTPPNTSSFSVGVFQGITENGLPNGTAFTPSKKQGVVDAVWTINRNSGTLGTDMTLAWPAALEGSSFSTYTSPQIGISHWDGPNWGLCSGTGNNITNTATRNGVSAFSPFSVGKTPYLLPVKFSYLNAAQGNGYNTLYWKAECSSSEVTFNVERSTDGRNFSPINTIVASQLRCAQPFTYVDNYISSGTLFYRIKSTEITGQETYSTIVKLSNQQTDMLLSAVLPNPVVNEAHLNIITSKKGAVELAVISMEGKVVNRSTVQLQGGSSIINIDVAALQPGVYMIRGRFSNGEVSTLKFIKQ